MYKSPNFVEAIAMPKKRKARQDKEVYGLLDYAKKHNITGPLFALAVPGIDVNSNIQVQPPDTSDGKDEPVHPTRG